MCAGVTFFDRGKREPPEQLVVVGADDVATERTEVAITDEPTIDAIDAAHVWKLVFEPRGRARRKQVGRFGDVRVAIDDLDAGELWTQARGVLGVVYVADYAARLIALVAPIPAG